MSGGCLRRAFEVGLAYMGRSEDVSFIPDKASLEDVGVAAVNLIYLYRSSR